MIKSVQLNLKKSVSIIVDLSLTIYSKNSSTENTLNDKICQLYYLLTYDGTCFIYFSILYISLFYIFQLCTYLCITQFRAL